MAGHTEQHQPSVQAGLPTARQTCLLPSSYKCGERPAQGQGLGAMSHHLAESRSHDTSTQGARAQALPALGCIQALQMHRGSHGPGSRGSGEARPTSRGHKSSRRGARAGRAPWKEGWLHLEAWWGAAQGPAVPRVLARALWPTCSSGALSLHSLDSARSAPHRPQASRQAE